MGSSSAVIDREIARLQKEIGVELQALQRATDGVIDEAEELAKRARDLRPLVIKTFSTQMPAAAPARRPIPREEPDDDKPEDLTGKFASLRAHR